MDARRSYMLPITYTFPETEIYGRTLRRMVYFFEFEVEGEKYTLYSPESKEEDSQILQYGIPTDIWFHIDGSKYLPVYLRRPKSREDESDLDELPRDAVTNSSQIAKHLANTKRDVFIRYTFLSNMSLNGPLDASQTKTTSCKTKKTGTIADPNVVATQKKRKVDFEAERIAYDELARKLNSEQYRKQQKETLDSSRQYKVLAEQKNRGYTDLFQDDDIVKQASNQNRDEDWEDDFM